MTILQTALDTIETLLTDSTSEQAQAAAADARIKIANAMTQVDFIAVPRDGMAVEQAKPTDWRAA